MKETSNLNKGKGKGKVVPVLNEVSRHEEYRLK
jgi:hypothetical protein